MHTVSFPFSKLFCIVFSVLVWSSEQCILSDDSHLHKSTSKFAISSLNLFSVSRGPAFPAQLWAGHWHPDRYVLPQRAQACQQAFSLTQLRSATVCDSTWQINKYSLNRGTYETQHSKLSHVFCAHTHFSCSIILYILSSKGGTMSTEKHSPGSCAPPTLVALSWCPSSTITAAAFIQPSSLLMERTLRHLPGFTASAHTLRLASQNCQYIWGTHSNLQRRK